MQALRRADIGPGARIEFRADRATVDRGAQQRREGELDALRTEWERAEEIAAIADNMFFEAPGVKSNSIAPEAAK